MAKRTEYLKARGSAARLKAPAPGFPGWAREGDYLLSRRVRISGGAVGAWPKEAAPEARDPEELLFFDTETTGLSGGAGSVIFLFGCAWCEGQDLVAEQLFLTDFPGEPDLLLAIKDRIANRAALVSYNGKAFDSRLLATRFVMNRIECEIGHQINLLHLSRRLWRPLTKDCTLRTVETKILGITRDVDVPGEEIPGIYFEFLRSGTVGLLPVVFQHNLTDVTSLARIWDAFGELLAGKESAAPVDEPSLGALLIDRKSEEGIRVLSDALRRGRLEAGVPLSLAYKRRGQWDMAVAVWMSMMDTGKSLFAALELAKFFEHRERNVERALELVEQALSWGLPLNTASRREVRKRRERLRTKASRQSPK